MGVCKDCLRWVIKRRRLYDDGSENVTFEAQPGKGFCDDLKLEVPPEFGCNKFSELFWSHIETATVNGQPWQFFKMGDCPECEGRGSGKEGGVCGRCVGLGKVRYYEDGYIGEERTRRHPKEPDPKKEQAIDPGTIIAKIEKPNPAEQSGGTL
jgi:hypothetical protein